MVAERYEQSVRSPRRSEQSAVTHIQTAETVQSPVPSITVSESANAPPPLPSSPPTKPSSPRTLKAVWRAFADAVRKVEQTRVDASDAAQPRTKVKTASLPRPAQAIDLTQAPPPKSEDPSPKTQDPSPKTQDPRPKSQAPSPKSQAPIPKPQAPKPDWLGNPPRLIDDCYQVSVSTTPYATPLDCSPELNQEIERAVDEYAARVLNGQAAGTIRLPMDYVHSHLVKSQYQEAVTTSVGPMVKLHALLEFDRETRSRIDQQWNDVLMVRRLRHAGGGLAGLLLVLSVAWGYLRTDLATAGAYRGRLRILATLAILTVSCSQSRIGRTVVIAFRSAKAARCRLSLRESASVAQRKATIRALLDMPASPIDNLLIERVLRRRVRSVGGGDCAALRAACWPTWRAGRGIGPPPRMSCKRRSSGS